MSPGSGELVKDLNAQLGDADEALSVPKGEVASSSSGADAEKMAVLEATIKELQKKFHEKEKELEASKKREPVAAATGETADMNQQASTEPEGEEDDDDVSSHPEVSQARQQLRRFCKRRSNGSLLVPEEVYNKFWQGGTERTKLLTLFLKNGRNKDMFLKEVKILSEKEKKMEMKIEGDYFELWELREIKKLPECRGCKCVTCNNLKHPVGSICWLPASSGSGSPRSLSLQTSIRLSRRLHGLSENIRMCTRVGVSVCV